MKSSLYTMMLLAVLFVMYPKTADAVPPSPTLFNYAIQSGSTDWYYTAYGWVFSDQSPEVVDGTYGQWIYFDVPMQTWAWVSSNNSNSSNIHHIDVYDYRIDQYGEWRTVTDVNKLTCKYSSTWSPGVSVERFLLVKGANSSVPQFFYLYTSTQYTYRERKYNRNRVLVSDRTFPLSTG